MSSITESNQPFYELNLSDLYPYDLQEQDKANVERVLNTLEWIPALNVAAGGFRAIYGVVQVIKGIVKATFCLIADLFVSYKLGFGYRTQKNILYTFHSIGNIIRGALQMCLIGYPIFLIHDLILNLRWRYPVEKSGVHYAYKNILPIK